MLVSVWFCLWPSATDGSQPRRGEKCVSITSWVYLCILPVWVTLLLGIDIGQRKRIRRKRKRGSLRSFFFSAQNRSSVEVIFNEEFRRVLVSVSHQLALITSSPLYTPPVSPTDWMDRRNLAKSSWVGVVSYLSARSCLNLIIYYSEDGEVVTRFPYVNLPGGRIIDTRSTLVSPFSICTAHFIYHYFSFLYQSFI